MDGNNGMRKRTTVLKTALLIEDWTSGFLSAFLDIPDYKNKPSFKGSTALSFNAKVNLLIDMGKLDKVHIKLFQTFMEIRNQFMHNKDADTYEKCFGYINGKSSFLLNRYKPDESLELEEKLEFVVSELSSEVVELTYKLTEKINEKVYKYAEAKLAKDFQEASYGTIDEMAKIADTYFNSLIDSGKEIKPETVKNFGKKIKNAFYKGMQKRLKWGEDLEENK